MVMEQQTGIQKTKKAFHPLVTALQNSPANMMAADIPLIISTSTDPLQIISACSAIQLAPRLPTSASPTWILKVATVSAAWWGGLIHPQSATVTVLAVLPVEMKSAAWWGEIILPQSATVTARAV